MGAQLSREAGETAAHQQLEETRAFVGTSSGFHRLRGGSDICRNAVIAPIVVAYRPAAMMTA